jgi:hypothetical protein
MAITIIIKDDHRNQAEISVELENDEDWEEICYRLGCQVARELSGYWLKIMEERLYQARDENLKVKYFRKRIRVTRFGSFTVRRRSYQDEHGDSHFLLDEYLNWLPYKHSTPSLILQRWFQVSKSRFNVLRRWERYAR